MPVLSPHRSSSSGLTGSYRSTFSSPSLDRTYYGSSSYSPRFTSYTSERYTTRSYESDGRRLFSRTASITEDGLTSRYREEIREASSRRDSLSRDSGISSIRESSILESRRDNSLTRGEGGRGGCGESRLSSLSALDSVADLRNKYSPANYVPAVLRNRDTNITRSKTYGGELGLPPLETARTTTVKKKVTTEANLNNTSSVGVRDFPNNTNCIETDNMYNQEDDNGNRPSVSEMRKKFDAGKGSYKITRASPLLVEGISLKAPSSNSSKKSDVSDVREKSEVRKAKKSLENGTDSASTSSTRTTNGTVKITTKLNGDLKKSSETRKVSVNSEKKVNIENSSEVEKKTKSKVEAGELKGGKVDASAATESSEQLQHNKTVLNGSSNHLNSLAPVKELEKGDSGTVNATTSSTATVDTSDYGGDIESLNSSSTKIKKPAKDLSTSPRLNRSPNSTQNAAASISPSQNSNSGSGRNSMEKDGYNSTNRRDYDEDRRYDRASPVKQLGLNGLKNIGNTCFMNSVIQCLSNTKPLLEYVKKDGYIADINTSVSSMKGALIKAFAQVIKELWSEDSSDRVVNTVALKSQIQRFAPRFMGYSQQDAQEFLRYLLEGLHEDVNRVTTKPAPIHTEIDEKLSDSEKAVESWQRYLRRENSKVVDLFVGQLKSTLKCTHCGHCSVTFDPFWDLSLPIPQKTGPIRLSQCLESFTREETLDGDEKPTCSKCKERRKCTKSFTIHKFPKILVIHLKRFSPTERFRGKLSVTVDFPLEGLDMGNYAAESHSPCRYNLYAISNHSGTTYSGHYTAYCRHPYTQSWHEYNDSRVSSISSKSIVSGEAYVLFYELDSKLAHL